MDDYVTHVTLCLHFDRPGTGLAPKVGVHVASFAHLAESTTYAIPFECLQVFSSAERPHRESYARWVRFVIAKNVVVTLPPHRPAGPHDPLGPNVGGDCRCAGPTAAIDGVVYPSGRISATTAEKLCSHSGTWRYGSKSEDDVSRQLFRST